MQFIIIKEFNVSPEKLDKAWLTSVIYTAITEYFPNASGK